MNRKLLLIGGGGHCKSVLDSLYRLKKYDSIGIIDIKEHIGRTILETPVIGSDEDLPSLYEKGFKEAFITVGSVGDPTLRIKIANSLKKQGFTLPNIVDPTATVSPYSDLADGIFIGKQTIINAGTKIKTGVIINSAVTIEHDCNIGEFVHVAPGSVLAGEVLVGNYTHLGANSVFKQQVCVGSNTIIGMGSIVLKDISSNVIAYGNPCREVNLR
ncbi:acetyltransferase [Paraliobacillus sediminis]|uniref:acetyltransferase n=1 Tax=Paraliobacillus sediminis TaxID=1885916 RepID=UPI000E3C4BFD|nr:acetyltransferase [Paraliobacillus sediminis]